MKFLSVLLVALFGLLVAAPPAEARVLRQRVVKEKVVVEKQVVQKVVVEKQVVQQVQVQKVQRFVAVQPVHLAVNACYSDYSAQYASYQAPAPLVIQRETFREPAARIEKEKEVLPDGRERVVERITIQR